MALSLSGHPSLEAKDVPEPGHELRRCDRGGVKMECGDWQDPQGEPRLGWEAKPSTEEGGRLL